MSRLTFDEWIARRLSPSLKKRGYIRRGNTYVTAAGQNFALVNLQTSTKSSTTKTIFTFNLGVWTARVGRFVEPGVAMLRPTLENCHWTARAGELLPIPEDKWWQLTSDESSERVLDEVESLLIEQGLLLLSAMSHDAALRDLWLSGRSPGLTNVQRLMYLSILVRALGPSQYFNGVLEELRRVAVGKPSSRAIARHIQIIGARAVE